MTGIATPARKQITLVPQNVNSGETAQLSNVNFRKMWQDQIGGLASNSCSFMSGQDNKNSKNWLKGQSHEISDGCK